MRLRTQFVVLVAVSLLVGLVGVLLFVVGLESAATVRAEKQRAYVVAREVSGLLALTQQYVLFGEERAVQQWRKRQYTIHQALEGALDIAVRRNMRNDLQSLSELFEEIEDAPRMPLNPLAARRRELVIDRLIAEAQSMADDTFEWEARLAVRSASVERRFTGIAIALLALMALLLAANGIFMGRRVLQPLEQLRATMMAVARGDTDPRSNNKRADEIGEVARSFDVMADDLQARNRALATNEAFLRTISDNLPTQIAYLDREERYRFVNAAQCASMRLPAERILGRTVRELRGVAAYETRRPYIERALAGENVRYYRVDKTANDSERHVEVLMIPDRGPEGLEEIRGLYSMVIDITELQMQKERIEGALHEKETLLKEVYHRVKNNLQVMQSLLNLQMRTLPAGSNAREVISETINRIRAMALVHEKLYQAGNLAAVDLPQYVHDLFLQLQQATGSQQRGIELNAEIDPVQLSLETAVPLGLLLTELISNSLKHAFINRDSGRIDVSLRLQQPSGAVLTVADNGIGLPADFQITARPSMGVKLINSLSAQLGGTLRISNDRGARFVLLLPEFEGATACA